MCILGDPGAVSGGGKKSKRARKKKSQEREKEPLSLALDLSSPEFFLARLDFFPPHQTAPGSPRMSHVK